MKDGRALLAFPLGGVGSGHGLNLDAAVASVEAGVGRKVGVALSTAVAPHAVRWCCEGSGKFCYHTYHTMT